MLTFAYKYVDLTPNMFTFVLIHLEHLKHAVQQPVMSIIVPVYNSQRYLARALDSAVSQTHQSFEIILINDGSTDNSSQIIEGYTRRYHNIRHVRLSENRGTLYARALGISLAAEFSVFLDADDELTPGCLRAAAEAQARSGADQVIFKTNKSTNGASEARDDPEEFYGRPCSGQELFNAIYYDGQRRFYWALWGKLFRTSMLQEAVKRLNVLVANRIIFSEDLLIYSAFLASNPLTIGIGEVGYVYYTNEESVTHQPGYSGGSSTYKKHLMHYFAARYCKQFYAEITKKFNVTLDLTDGTLSKSSFSNVQSEQNCQNVMALLVEYNLYDQRDFAKKYVNLIQNMITYQCNDQVMYWNSSEKRNYIEHWNNEDQDEIYRKNLSISQTMQLIDEVWGNSIKFGHYYKYIDESNGNLTLIIPLCRRSIKSHVLRDKFRLHDKLEQFLRDFQYLAKTTAQKIQQQKQAFTKIVIVSEEIINQCQDEQKILADELSSMNITNVDIVCVYNQLNQYLEETILEIRKAVVLASQCAWKVKMFLDARGADTLVMK